MFLGIDFLEPSNVNPLRTVRHEPLAGYPTLFLVPVDLPQDVSMLVRWRA